MLIALKPTKDSFRVFLFFEGIINILKNIVKGKQCQLIIKYKEEE